MAVPAEVNCITTRGTGETEAITHIGGRMTSFFVKSKWRLKADDAIAKIEQDEWRFFATVGDRKVWLDVDEDEKGRKRLLFHGELGHENLVEALPSCPV